MEIAVRTEKGDPTRAKKALSQDLGFGKIFADRMFSCATLSRRAGMTPRSSLWPRSGAMVLHYAQEIFEGQKAYRWPDGRLAMFRPEMNAARMNRSARRLCMPGDPPGFRSRPRFAWLASCGLGSRASSSLYVRLP
jgi:branched-chain amino acid aminotransferase